MATGCYPGFDRTGNSAVQSADPENPTVEPNLKWIGRAVAEIWPFEIQNITRGAFGTPIFREGEVLGGHRSYHWKERRWFPIGFHCDHCEISDRSATICIESLLYAQVNRGRSLWVNILGCSLWSTSLMLGSAKNEHPSLSDREITFEDFQVMWSR